MSEMNLTGKPSVDRPWLKYYPEALRNIEIPTCTFLDYMKASCKGEDLVAINYYDTEILWSTVFEKVDEVARSLKALGLKEGDQLPVFLASVPEFIYILLGAEKIGVSLLCRDNTLEENVEAVAKAGSKVMIAHDFLGQKDLEEYFKHTAVEKVILIDACNSCDRNALPGHIAAVLNSRYTEESAHGEGTLNWNEFLALGKDYTGSVDAKIDTNRPLLRAYTSGSTGPSKQVVHSARTMLSIMHQMNFYATSDEYRPTWLLAVLPPALIAAVVSMMMLPLASNKILILSPFCAPEDIDLEVMRCRPNCSALIPMFIEIIMRSERIPADYDMSHLIAAGAGCESFNNNQIMRTQKFLKDHNCDIRFTAGYGSSEAGSNVTMPMTPHPMGNGNVGVPMVLNNTSIFVPGTQEELTYNQLGEICITGPGVMLGYDNPEATAATLQTHEDGELWLHTGDIGYMDEDGVIYILTRGKAPRYGGGDLATLPMENIVADANIEGIDDEFFVVIPDERHPGCFIPYLYVVLKDGYTIQDIEGEVRECLEDYMQPVDIIEIPERPFFHFKTNRIGLTQSLLQNNARFNTLKQSAASV